MRFIESVFEKLKRHPKRIVFPEGAEPRVLEAAGRFNRMQLGAPILLGDIEEIERKAEQHGIDLTRIGIIDPDQGGRPADFRRSASSGSSATGTSAPGMRGKY